MTALDSDLVLEHLAKVQRITRSNVVQAFAAGFEDRTRRGEFDLKEPPC